MLREIIIPSDNAYLLRLPDKFIGKTVEVIAFEVKDKNVMVKPAKNAMEETLQFYDSINIDLSGHHFNRDEANER